MANDAYDADLIVIGSGVMVGSLPAALQKLARK